MVGCGRPTRNVTNITTDRGHEAKQRDPHDVQIERLQQGIRDLELQQEVQNEEIKLNPSVWDGGYDEEENPFSFITETLRRYIVMTLYAILG